MSLPKYIDGEPTHELTKRSARRHVIQSLGPRLYFVLVLLETRWNQESLDV
jgi:hypothetical protein